MMNGIIDFLGLASLGAFLGAAGSFLLLLPPLADQFSRLAITRRRSDVANTSGELQRMSATALNSLERRASRWKFWESFSMALGSALLMASFWFVT